MIMASGLNHGLKASVPHLMGICIGVPTMFLAVGFGLSYLFNQYPWLHSLIQLAGIAYLVYLAWLIADSAPVSVGDGDALVKKPLSFLQAALFQWINPKAWMMGTGAIAVFTTDDGCVGRQIVVMALVFFFMALPSAGVWLVFGAWLKRLFNDQRHLVLFNRVMALLLLVSVLPIAISVFNKYIPS